MSGNPEPDLASVVAALRAMSLRCYGNDVREVESALLEFVRDLLYGERELWRCYEELRLITRRELASVISARASTWIEDTLRVPIASVPDGDPTIDDVERALFPEG